MRVGQNPKPNLMLKLKPNERPLTQKKIEPTMSAAKTLCLNMIVKNEAAIIETLLASVADSIDYYVICDTGSTDDTVNIIRNFFDAKEIQGEIHHIKFNDFSQARNDALKLAQESKHPFDYILLGDADMQLVVEDPDFRKHLTADCYQLIQKNQWQSYYNARLVKKDITSYYVGRTHEYLYTEEYPRQCTGAYYLDHCTGSSRGDKYQRDIKLLKLDLKEDPSNARSCFYLANTYFDAGDKKNALKYYQQRVDLGGWHEEVFYSKYRIIQCLITLEKPAKDILAATMDCHQFHAKRAEPLYEMAKYYREKAQYASGYAFAKAASCIPYPQSDILFVADVVYQYQIADELSICAYWTERYDESKAICEWLLQSEHLPVTERERVEKNLTFAQQKLIPA